MEDIIKYVGAVIAVVSVVIAAILKLYSFRENTLVPQLLNRYDRVTNSLREKSDLKKVVQLAIEEEAFRVIFQQGGSPEYQKALRKLYESRKLSLFERNYSAEY